MILNWLNWLELFITEFPHKFTKTLLSVQAADKEAVMLECEVDEDGAGVIWKKDGEIFKPTDKKFAILKDCKRAIDSISIFDSKEFRFK